MFPDSIAGSLLADKQRPMLELLRLDLAATLMIKVIAK
jgi:hypothetical protein